MQFRCDNHGVTTLVDALPEHGGTGQAATPKELVLNAMMGCTAMDVISILKKMRLSVLAFDMEILVEKTTEHPVHFKAAEMIYDLQGPIDPDKAIKAVDSSLTKYCGVNYMISQTCEITYKLKLNGAIIKQAPVTFTGPSKG